MTSLTLVGKVVCSRSLDLPFFKGGGGCLVSLRSEYHMVNKGGMVRSFKMSDKLN